MRTVQSLTLEDLLVINQESEGMGSDSQTTALHLGLGSSVQCSTVGLCLYLHPDEGSMVICKIFISVAMGEGQF